MRYYETLYIINPNLSDEDYRDVVSKFNGLIEKNRGVVIKVDEWGKKTFAYELKKFDRGYYVLLKYCGEPGLTEELQRYLNLDDSVIKYQTVKLSDKADPDALKAKMEESEVKTTEETQTVDEIGPEEKAVSEKTEEDENGV